MKRLIKSAIHRFGFDIVRYVPEFHRPFDVLSLLVRDRLASGKPFFFVQVGANDGVQDDPIRSLVLEHHLRGLLIEPQPDIFARLCDNYAQETQLLFENVAIASKQGVMTLYKAKSGIHDSKNAHGWTSFDRRHLEKENVPDSDIEQIQVQAVPLSTLIPKHNITDVTVMLVDVEGYDYQIVKSTLGSGILPQIIHYEHCHLVPADRFACKRLLDEYNYQFIEAGKDTIATRAM